MLLLLTLVQKKSDLFLCWSGMLGFNPNRVTLEQVADRLIKRIACTYPKAYKLVLNKDTAIDIMAGNVTKCIFEIRRIENLKDYDDSFLC